MNKKILIVISIVVAAIVIPFGIYTISPLFTNITVNEPLPTTAIVRRKNVNLAIIIWLPKKKILKRSRIPSE
ncbi:MAG TPA: hypothetical protein VH500_00670 [Nitrososphaeraceae archaeon]|jgi:hypothetical protein